MNQTEEIQKLVVKGLTRIQILDYAQKKGWGITPQSVDSILENVKATFKGQVEALDVEAELGKSLERFQDLYNMALKVQDYKTALAIEKERARILKLQLAHETKSDPKRKFKLVR